MLRTSVSDKFDLLVAIGSPERRQTGPDSFYWGEQEKLGLLLQERDQPDRLYPLVIKPGRPDCIARVERVTETGVVISCTGEKGWQYPNHVFVYDVRTKTLLRQSDYNRFATWRLFGAVASAIFVCSDT